MDEKIVNRPALIEICKHIPENSRVLDLGCEDGTLLEILRENYGAKVHGIEIDQQNISKCISKGIPVIQADLNEGLGSFQDNSFDFVILSETFQMVKNPDYLLSEMMRVGKTGIINFINIGYWLDRFQLFFGGRMPKNKHLPHEWYNTPNIHLGTIKDFQDLCKTLDIKITQQQPIFAALKMLPKVSPNLFAKKCVFLIEK